MAPVEYCTEDLILCIQMRENSLRVDRCLRRKYIRAEPVGSKKTFLRVVFSTFQVTFISLLFLCSRIRSK